MLSAALASADRPNSVCAGLIMSNIAALLETSGRLAEAEPMGQRAVHTLEESLPPGHPALARPLHTLAAAQFQQGKITRARHDCGWPARPTSPACSESAAASLAVIAQGLSGDLSSFAGVILASNWR
jgi:hypothetical protein